MLTQGHVTQQSGSHKELLENVHGKQAEVAALQAQAELTAKSFAALVISRNFEACCRAG